MANAVLVPVRQFRKNQAAMKIIVIGVIIMLVIFVAAFVLVRK